MQPHTFAKYRAELNPVLTGTRFCSHCQAYRPADTFHKRVNGRNVRHICADCWGRIKAHMKGGRK